MATIIAVARKAGVSPATISRYFNNPELVKEETCQRIQVAVHELNFVPNTFAQGLVTGRSGVIAVVVPDIANPGFSVIVRGCSDVLDTQQKTLCVYNCDHPWDEGRIRAAVERQQVDGVIVASQERLSDTNADGFYATPLPAVFIDRTPASETTDAVFVDNRAVTELACTHLASLGHTRIGIVTGNMKTHSAMERHQYFLESMAQLGLFVHETCIFESDFKFQGGVSVAHRVAAMLNPPTALFVSNDIMALGLMSELVQLGWEIPRQLSIVGCLDIWAASIATPGLTTVRVPSYDMGREAAHLLMERLKNRAQPQMSKVFPVELVIRGSTARAGID